MLEGLSEKLKKFKMPEESLIKKIDKLKKSSETDSGDDENTHITNNITEQLKQTEEELTRKIEEAINSKSEQIDANAESVKEFDDKLNKIESSVSSSKHQVEEFKDRLDKIDENLLELLSLYEVVSSTVNPFVADKSGNSEKFQEIEQKIEALSQTSNEFPADMKEKYDIKFKALEDSLQVLTDIVESNKFDQESLVEKVSEQVLVSIKPLLVQIQNQQINNDSYEEESSEDTYGSLKPAVPRSRSSQNGNDVKLAHLDNKAETSIILLNWIEFLMEKVGRNNLQEVLEYYIAIGWISEEVCKKMITFANGIDYYVERPTWKLLPEDHTKSLVFIEQLTGRKIDKHMLSKIERDVEKVIKPEMYTI